MMLQCPNDVAAAGDGESLAGLLLIGSKRIYVGIGRGIEFVETDLAVGMCPTQGNHSVAQLKGGQGSSPSCDMESIMQWMQECNLSPAPRRHGPGAEAGGGLVTWDL